MGIYPLAMLPCLWGVAAGVVKIERLVMVMLNEHVSRLSSLRPLGLSRYNFGWRWDFSYQKSFSGCPYWPFKGETDPVTCSRPFPQRSRWVWETRCWGDSSPSSYDRDSNDVHLAESLSPVNEASKAMCGCRSKGRCAMSWPTQNSIITGARLSRSTGVFSPYLAVSVLSSHVYDFGLYK